MTNRIAVLACAALMILMSGCGYRLLGAGAKPAGAAVTIGELDDRSREPIFGALLRTALATQAVERGELRLVPAGTSGALTLETTVNTLAEQGRAYIAGGLPREYLLTIQADAVLRDDQGEAAWKVRNVQARREFHAGADLNQTRANKDMALRQLAADLAGELLRRAALSATALEAK